MNCELPKRSFIIGDEWIYYKFYSGVKTADMILIDLIKPISEQLLRKEKIDQWFFIRYSDPDPHLRVRLHYTKMSSIGVILQFFFKQLKEFTDQELIWKVQIDTYQREIERYGANTIELSEYLFYKESVQILDTLTFLRNGENENYRWFFALRLIDQLLNCFQITLSEKLKLMNELKTGFGEEFGMNHFIKTQLDKKYRMERKNIENILGDLSFNLSDTLRNILDLSAYKKDINPIVTKIMEINANGNLEMTIEKLLGSYIHMTMNRIFRSNQRFHEMVLYDYLFRYYRSINAQKKRII